MLQILLHRSGARSLACEVDGDSGASVSEGVLNLLADNMHRMGSFTLKGSPILLQKCILRAAPKLESLMLIGVEPLPPQLFDGRAGRLRNLALHNFQSLPLNRAFSAITHLSIEGDMTHRRIRVHDLFSAFPRLKSLSVRGGSEWMTQPRGTLGSWKLSHLSFAVRGAGREVSSYCNSWRELGCKRIEIEEAS
ncbi:hypothetical protein AURDEDRAFT_177921 [Auricularia subglabra TFB-10046 SS5]|uniref:F-box domain-containing protein n=1 Tax=Auricularia subglabra (strain TFB-10046 / SS5) TaxID=717982 RepID=J0L9G2_AURST|nr:hypothetical protein AURDEDRAFT_177921 [Auricularia subglabra TFB-10046 SS5]